MTHWYFKAPSTVGTGTGRAAWTQATQYVVGDRVIKAGATGNPWTYECTSTSGSGTSGGSEPSWPSTPGTTVTDNPGANQVVWTCRQPSTWANAHMYLNNFFCSGVAYWAAGDTCWLDNTIVQVISGSLQLPSSSAQQHGSATAQTNIISTSDLTHEPPTSRATGVIIRASTFIDLIACGQGLYYYGIQFEAGYGGSGTQYIALGGQSGAAYNLCCKLESCTLKLAVNTAASYFRLGQENAGYYSGTLQFLNTNFEFSHASQTIIFEFNVVHIQGGSITGTAPNCPFKLEAEVFNPIALITGMDLSLCGTNLLNCTNFADTTLFKISRCRLNASVVPFLNTPSRYGAQAILENCSAIGQNYRVAVQQRGASLVEETTIVRTDGATDGATTLSWKIVSNANNSNVTPFLTPAIGIYNAETGAEKTVTVEIIHDNVTGLTDNDIWLEVVALTDEDSVQATLVTDAGNPGLAAANQTTSTAPWTTTGLTNPNRQKLSVTFTPQQVGLITARVNFTKVSYTVYVDPKLTIS